MSREDRERWNRCYSDRTIDWDPNSWLLAVTDEIRAERPGALALDVACGNGRNAIQLARLGYAVDAWDVSDVGLSLLREHLAELTAADERLDVHPLQVDLDAATIPPDRYDLIVNVFFLDRRLFPAYVSALRPGGRLVFETFANYGDGRRAHVRPEHMLRLDELREAFADLEMIRYEEEAERGTARLLACKR